MPGSQPVNQTRRLPGSQVRFGCECVRVGRAISRSFDGQMLLRSASRVRTVLTLATDDPTTDDRKGSDMNRALHGLGLACLAAALVTLSGCASWSASQRAMLRFNYPHAGSETLTQAPDEHYHVISRVSATDARALVEDLDLLFLTDRPTRLTRWHDR